MTDLWLPAREQGSREAFENYPKLFTVASILAAE